MLNLVKFLPRMFNHRGDPLQFIFFVTSKCNLKCRHCFYAENLNNPKEELSLGEIEKISLSMGNLLWFSMTGGEPFMRKDLPQIAEIFYRNNKFSFLTINTNGLLRDSMLKSVAEISKSCPKAHILVYVSLDGLEETHSQIRGALDGFKKAIESIRELKKLKNNFKNLTVGTVTTCNSKNQKEMKDLALFLKDKVKPDTITVNLIRGKPRLGSMGDVDLKNYFDFIKVQEQAWSSGELPYFNFFTKTLLQKKELLQKKIIATIFNENRYVLPCLAGNISCVMTEAGDVYPCEILNRKIGNIRDKNYDFKKVWYSMEAEEVRKFIKNSKCFCTYECAISTNILFNPGQLAMLFSTPRI
ncbi:MAG: radical SAM protein [Patescibacteria group bacterium]